jgi:hypothetical protein
MSWRYDVFECNNEADDHSKCEVMTGPPKQLFWNGGWKDAYRLAEALPHAIVVREYKGELGWSRKSVTVFEHIEGGGICLYCREGRGPLCNLPVGNRFLCEPCRIPARRWHEMTMRDHGTEPIRERFVPVIDTLDWEAE